MKLEIPNSRFAALLAVPVALALLVEEVPRFVFASCSYYCQQAVFNVTAEPATIALNETSLLTGRNYSEPLCNCTWQIDSQPGGWQVVAGSNCTATLKPTGTYGNAGTIVVRCTSGQSCSKTVSVEAGVSTFRVQGSIDGGSSWASDNLTIYGKPGEYADVALRVAMTVTNTLSQGWSYSMKHDTAAITAGGGSLDLLSVTTAGTHTETVQAGAPADFEMTETRDDAATVLGFIQGVAIDDGSTGISLEPILNFVTAGSCYRLQVPSQGSYQAGFVLAHNVGDGRPQIESLISQGGGSTYPKLRGFTLKVYSHPNYSTPPGDCNATWVTSGDGIPGPPPPEGGGAGLPEGGGGGVGGCTTDAVVTATFGGGGPGVQTGCVFQDDDLLQAVDGHAMDSSGVLFVAREVDGPNGGVTRVDLSGAKTSGSIPITADKLEKIASNMRRADQVVWEEATNDLLVTLERRNPNGKVVRLDLDANPPSASDETAPNEVDNPEGIVIVPEDHCDPPNPGDFGNPGELLIAEDVEGGRIRKFGVESASPCPAGDRTVFTAAGTFGRPEGMAIGDFNGAGVFAAYFAATSEDTIYRLTATDPVSFVAQPFSEGGFEEPDNVVFDPFSGGMFVSEDRPDDVGRIWRVRPDGSKVLFATGMDSPQGMSFHPSGVMLVSEQQPSHENLIAIDGWRNRFNRGDADAKGSLEITDSIFILGWVFLGGPEPPCLDAADVNDDGHINISDPIYLLGFLFLGTPPPPQPFFGTDPNGQCETDPTIDLIGCLQFVPGCEVTF